MPPPCRHSLLLQWLIQALSKNKQPLMGEAQHPPKARQVVMTAGRPSGMAATARATAILR